MARKDRRPPPSVKEQLRDKPQSFSFFQAIRLLRFLTGSPEGPALDEFFRNRLRIRPYLSLAFPSNDLTDLHGGRDEDGRVRFHLTATFLGLYGAASPLPTFYTEELLDEASDDGSVTRDFLDIFNNDFFIQFYRMWSKYRLMLKVVDENDQDYLERLFCLMGFGHASIRSKVTHPRENLRYVGLFTQFPRSAMGLRALVSDKLQNRNVEVRQCVNRLVTIPEDQRCFLGVSGNNLGEDAWVGERLGDRMGRIAIEVHQLDADSFQRLLPGRTVHRNLAELTRLFLVEPLEVDLTLSLKDNEVETAQPGNHRWSRLGYDTWLFAGQPSGEPEVSLTRFCAAC